MAGIQTVTVKIEVRGGAGVRASCEETQAGVLTDSQVRELVRELGELAITKVEALMCHRGG